MDVDVLQRRRKSDPYFLIRPAFGRPGGIAYVSPNRYARCKSSLQSTPA